MSMTEQYTNSSGNQTQMNRGFYRFSVIQSEDLNIEIELPDSADEVITPIVAHTDDIFKKAFFTYDTDLFVHRVGLCNNPEDKNPVSEETLNYIVLYSGSFVSAVREFVAFNNSCFTLKEEDVSEISALFPEFEVKSYSCVFDTPQCGKVTLPIRTTVFKVDSYEIAVRSIPEMKAPMWIMQPALFPMKLYEENDRVRNAVNDWIAECQAYCDILNEELLTLCKMMSIQRGVKHVYPATVFEYESPIYTVLADHTATHAIQVVLAGGLVIYLVRGVPHCYSITGDFTEHAARIVKRPIIVKTEEATAVFGNDMHISVTANSYKILELTTELESVDVFRKKLMNTLFP